MKNIRLFTFLSFMLLPNLIFCQMETSLETRVKYLEQSLDSLKSLFKDHISLYEHDDIELNTIRSRLALEINRNFTLFAVLYEAKPDIKDGNSFQRIFIFNGYRSGSDHYDAIEYNQARHLEIIRHNLKAIKDIVIGKISEPFVFSDGFTVFPNRLIINYYDNSSSGQLLITADTELKTLKVRINGIMQEVGWE